MDSWRLDTIETPDGTRSPVVLATLDGARAIVLRLEPGQELGEHEVRERAWLVVVEGSAEVTDGSAAPLAAPSGTLITFAPGERHTVRSDSGARLLLLLAPWPGDGHFRDDVEAGAGAPTRTPS